MTTGVMFAYYAHSALTAISLLVWMLALTIRLPNETRAGLLAMGLLIFWMLATAGLGVPSVPPLLLDISPLAFIYMRKTREQVITMPPLAVVLAVQAGIVLLLWLWASRQLAGTEGQS